MGDNLQSTSEVIPCDRNKNLDDAKYESTTLESSALCAGTATGKEEEQKLRDFVMINDSVAQLLIVLPQFDAQLLQQEVLANLEDFSTAEDLVAAMVARWRPLMDINELDAQNINSSCEGATSFPTNPDPSRSLHESNIHQEAMATSSSTNKTVIHNTTEDRWKCQCCYFDQTDDSLIQCFEGHIFCHECLLRYAKPTIGGQGGATFHCMMENCERGFPRDQLQAFLPLATLQLLDEWEQKESVRLALMDERDLHQCPHCSFKCILDPEETILLCRKPDCGQATCRICKEPYDNNHYGRTCSEIKKPGDSKLVMINSDSRIETLDNISGYEDPLLQEVILTNLGNPFLVDELGASMDPGNKTLKTNNVQNFFSENELRGASAIPESAVRNANPPLPSLFECQCCFDEHDFDNLVQCFEGHLFCKDCLRRYAESTIGGQGSANLRCMTGDCEQGFPRSQLEGCLPVKTLKLLDEREQEESVRLATVDQRDLAQCPHCSFKCFMPIEDNVFQCHSPDCGRITCRLCKEPWDDNHIGISCSDVEKSDEAKLRKTAEEKMTAKRLRVCHKCQTPLIKEAGCNKIPCRCGAILCYVCRKPLVKGYNDEHGYHFCQHRENLSQRCSKCDKCSLWGDPKPSDDEAIEGIRSEAENDRSDRGFSGGKKIG